MAGLTELEASAGAADGPSCSVRSGSMPGRRSRMEFVRLVVINSRSSWRFAAAAKAAARDVPPDPAMMFVRFSGKTCRRNSLPARSPLVHVPVSFYRYCTIYRFGEPGHTARPGHTRDRQTVHKRTSRTEPTHGRKRTVLTSLHVYMYTGDVQFPIVFGYSFLSDTYPDVS